MGTEVLQDIAGAGQGQREVVAVLLHLLLAILRRRIVGHGTAHHHHVEAVTDGCHGIEHLGRRRHRHSLHTEEGLQGHRSRHQRDLCPTQPCHLGEGVAHLARRMIGDEPHGVEGLARGPRRHQHPLALHVVRQGDVRKDVLHQQFLGGQLAASDVATGQPTSIGLYHLHAIVLQPSDIVLQQGVGPHPRIHRRRHQYGALAGHEGSGEHIVADAVGHLADDIGRGRRHEQHVGLGRQRHMLHGIVEVAVEGIDHAAPRCQRLEGEGSNELGGVTRHHHVHPRM